MFAEKYLQKDNRKALIDVQPKTECEIIVVIPCFREPDILQTLESVLHCEFPKSNVEVIILINHSETEDEKTKSYNLETKRKIENWISESSNPKIDFYAVGPVELQKKWAGAGLARKSGMDEAVRRFDLLEKPNGIIVSLDADTLVEKNYFVEIENYFTRNPKHVGATIAFQHQTEELESKHLEGIRLYEKYMNYYKMALEYVGYPYPMFTVGSAFVVKAGAYVKRGGMNRRQAGEDFYFLQNLVQVGIVGEIKSTKVFPSARISDRVPFGTGPILQKWMKGEKDLARTYNFKAFMDLKSLFNVKHNFYKTEKKLFDEIINTLPESVQRFIEEDHFWNEVSDLNKNCSTSDSFQSRFFHKFNAFKILKFLNFAHGQFYAKEDLETQFQTLNNLSKIRH